MQAGQEISAGYHYLRRYDWTAKAAYETAKRMSRVIGAIGDLCPVDHDGGYVFKTEDGYHLEYIVACSCGCWSQNESTRKRERGGDETGHPWEVYRCDLGDSDFPDWPDWDDIARCIGREREDFGEDADPEDDIPTLYKKQWRKGNALARACILEDVASYHGWYELDQYPLHLDAHEVYARYGDEPTVDVEIKTP